MEIGETLYVVTREEWRNWLIENHSESKEIWLKYYIKKSNKPRISYDEAVEEALCFGWIDGIMKKIDNESNVQRFTPRRANSALSQLNKIRIKKMYELGKMTKAGLDIIKKYMFVENGKLIDVNPFVIPEDILKIIKKDSELFKNFKNLPEDYKLVRIAYIEGYREFPEIFKKRLDYFIKMTKKNKMFGTKL